MNTRKKKLLLAKKRPPYQKGGVFFLLIRILEAINVLLHDQPTQASRQGHLKIFYK